MSYILTDYVDSAMLCATYERQEDGTFAGEIDLCPGVYAFGDTLHECRAQLRSVLEGWILLGLQLNHPLPIIDGIDLNVKDEVGSLVAM